MPLSKRPVIGIATGREFIHGREFHAARAPIIDVVRLYCHAVPVMIPAMGRDDEYSAEILSTIDGLFLPGGRSHVSPEFYGSKTIYTEQDHDLFRDNTTLALIRAAVEMDMPILGICRGHQEINVAMGGSLHQNINEVEGRASHIPDLNLPLHEALKIKHPLNITQGGLLSRLGIIDGVHVNTSHCQAIDRVAKSLVIEATAPDGTIEAISRPQSSFVVGVQWHPEMEPESDPTSKPLLMAFAQAVLKYQLS